MITPGLIYSTVWKANTEIGLDPINNVMKTLWSSQTFIMLNLKLIIWRSSLIAIFKRIQLLTLSCCLRCLPFQFSSFVKKLKTLAVYIFISPVMFVFVANLPTSFEPRHEKTSS